MKKNWLPIVVLIAFVIVWEMFVLKPYNDGKRKAVEAQKVTVAAANTNSQTSAPATTTNAGSPAVNPIVSEDERASSVEISLGDKRHAKVFNQGLVGSAFFGDYNKRETKDVAPIVLLEQGFKWSSTDASVQGCLRSMKTVNNLTFSAEVADGSCRLDYVPDGTKPGLMNARLTLKGFAASKGFVEFKGTDVLGTAGAMEDHNGLRYYLNDSKENVRDKKLFEATGPQQGKVSWLAWGDRYFASTLIPVGSYNPNIVYGPKEPGKTNPKTDAVTFGFQYPLINPGAETIYELSLLFSVRDSAFLSTIRPDLVNSVELGFFPLIARSLIFALKLIYGFVGNYGVAIIVLTLLVRLAFWPLNKKVYQSGQKMKALGPAMEKIKAKYGGDKSRAQEMNIEVMGLYKKHGVNPLGSCLPMLLQLPIWFGLYQALNHSLDLYQAPFFGWITDLSARDPFFIFPALWTISLVVYIFINPQPQQPGQPDMRWMMLAMNLVFGYMSASWPAGLTLYLFVSNFVGIVQQLMMSRSAKKLQPITEGA